MHANIAVVLVEFQNIWTRPGLYNSLIRREERRRGVVANAALLVAAARRASAPVIHAPLVIDPANKKGLFAKITRGLVFRKGSAAARIDERVLDDSDTVVVGRTAFDAFVDSDLEAQLRRLKVSSALFAGFATDQCVAKTMRTATRRGFDAWLVHDASATFARMLQTRVEREFGNRSVSTLEAIAMLQRAHLPSEDRCQVLMPSVPAR